MTELENPNVQRFLNMVALAEGTAKPGVDPYRVNFGGSQMDDLSAHPGVRREFTQTDGKKNYTTAAGKYQFLKGTWDDVAGKLGLQDFSPQSQDAAAVELLRRNGALPHVLNGDFNEAVKRSGSTWASLPSSPYAQPKRSEGFIEKALGAVIPSAQAQTTKGNDMANPYDSIFANVSGGQQQPQSPYDEIFSTISQSVAQPAPTTPAGQSANQGQPAPQQRDHGTLAALGAAGGKAFGDGVLGLQQLAGKGLEAVGGNSVVGDAGRWLTNDATQGTRRNAEEAAKFTRGHGVANAVGTVAGMIANPINRVVPLGGASAMGTVGRAAAQGAISGAVMPASETDNFWMNKVRDTAVGAGIGAAGGAVINGASRLLSNRISASPEAVAAANRIGYKPTPAQLTGNPAQANFENYLARTPGGSRIMQDAAAANQTSLNRAAGRAIGQTVDKLDEAVLGGAKHAIGGEYTRLNSLASPQTASLAPTVQRVAADNAARGAFANPAVSRLVDQADNLVQQGNLSGKAYNAIRSELSSRAQGAFQNGDATLGQALKAVRDSLDAAAEASLPQAERGAYKLARDQWSALKALTKGNVVEAGDVSAARVASALRRGGDQFRTGALHGDLADIARVGEAFKGATNPNSGNLAAYATSLTDIPVMMTNNALARMYMSPIGQRAMTQGLLGSSPTAQSVAGLLRYSRPQPLTQGLLSGVYGE